MKIIQAIQAKAQAFATFTVTTVTSGARQITQLGSKAYDFASPALKSAVSKVSSFDLNAVWTSGKAFMKSPLGMGFAALALAVVCIAFCKEPLQLSARNIASTFAAGVAVVTSAALFVKGSLFGTTKA